MMVRRVEILLNDAHEWTFRQFDLMLKEKYRIYDHDVLATSFLLFFRILIYPIQNVFI